MADERLEAVLTQFAERLETLASEDEAAQVLAEFNRASGYAGRSDASSVPMINGAVVGAQTWAEYSPRFIALRTLLESARSRFMATNFDELKSRRTGTLKLYFPASLEDPETGETVDDAKLLALCDGATDETGLEDSPSIAASPVLALPIGAHVEHDAAKGELHVVLSLALERQPTNEEVQRIGAAVHGAMFSGWGLNPNFDLPDSLADYTFQFEPSATRAVGEEWPAKAKAKTKPAAKKPAPKKKAKPVAKTKAKAKPAPKKKKAPAKKKTKPVAKKKAKAAAKKKRR